jgi:acyl-coenzyme A thioesterase PaaI-like protein
VRELLLSFSVTEIPMGGNATFRGAQMIAVRHARSVQLAEISAVSASSILSTSIFAVAQAFVFSQIKKRSIAGVPFASHMKLEPLDVGRGKSIVFMGARPFVYNQAATVHNGAQFALAEAASGLAMAGALAPLILAVRPVVAEAHMQYFFPGTGTLRAEGTVREDAARLTGMLESDCRVRLTVDVEVTDEAGNVVSVMTAHWHVRLK